MNMRVYSQEVPQHQSQIVIFKPPIKRVRLRIPPTKKNAIASLLIVRHMPP